MDDENGPRVSLGIEQSDTPGPFTPNTPNPDFSAGGSLVGWGPVLAEILKLDFDVVVPGTGPMIARGELEAFKKKIDTLVSRATELIKKGVQKDQLMAQLKTDDLGWRVTLPETGSTVSTPNYLERNSG